MENYDLDIPIDAVITWVDGSDEKHKEKIREYIQKTNQQQENISFRYAQTNEIQFCVNSILKHANFVRNIFIVTDNQVPKFLVNESSDGIRDISSGRTLIKKGTKLTTKRLSTFNLERFDQSISWVENKNVWKKIKAVWRSFWKEWRMIEETLEKEVFKLRIGDELQPGILKLAKVDIANKRIQNDTIK